MNDRKHYTLYKLFFNEYGEIIDHYDPLLKPMTLEEACAMRSKQINPNDWQVVKIA